MDLTYQIVTNYSCNLDCTYCYERKFPRNNDIDAVVDFLHACFERDKDVDKDCGAVIDVIGGEPFMQPKLLIAAFETAEALAKKYSRPWIIAVSTNGTLFDKEINQNIVKRWARRMSIGISIDGLPEQHDKYRIYASNGKGSYEQAVKGLNFLKTLPLKELGIKATFTNETKHHYAASMKHIIDLSEGRVHLAGNITYEDALPRSEAIWLANQQIEVLEYWISKGYHVAPKSQLAHLAGEGHGPIEWFPSNRDLLKIPEFLTDPERVRPWCGSVKYMTCLGFDRKVYGCNRFLSPIQDRHVVYHLVGRTLVPNTECTLEKEIEVQYLDYPSSCVACPSKSMCASCAAAPYEHGEGSAADRKAYHAERRQCGWTMSRVLVLQWWKQRFGSYDDQTPPHACDCPTCRAKAAAQVA